MDTEQTANQLELAAAIIRTGHPWEYRCPHSIPEWKKEHRAKVDPIYRVASKWEIRLVLATPPDNRPLHNPSNLTAEQVGAGWRLTLENEWNPLQEYWHSTEQWKKSTHLSELDTFRLPLSTPWPEAEKPAKGNICGRLDCPQKVTHYEGEAPTCSARPETTFTLPTPPPNIQWHRLDGWKEGDLPQGWRPLVLGERSPASDEINRRGFWEKLDTPGDIPDTPAKEHTYHCRTTRPLVFTHAGKTWTWHRTGDPMPCDGEREVDYVYRDHTLSGFPSQAIHLRWSELDHLTHDNGILGWRYADKHEPREVDLGPEDVPPGSVFRGAGEAKDPNDKGWCLITSSTHTGIRYWNNSDTNPKEIKWSALRESGAQINRPRHRDADGNPTLWEPCSKKVEG